MKDRIYEAGWLFAALIAALLLSFVALLPEGQFRDYGRAGLGGGLADVRLQYTPVPTESWSPFAYAGAGVLRYDWSKQARSRTDAGEPIGWSVVVPVGAGIRYKLTNRLALDADPDHDGLFAKAEERAGASRSPSLERPRPARSESA